MDGCLGEKCKNSPHADARYSCSDSHGIVFLSAILCQSKSMTKILCYMLINPVSDSHHRRAELVKKPVS